jgi:hypothetical protein
MPPVVPPTLFAVSVTVDPAFDAAALALDDTLERPSDALDAASDAFSFAASVVDEALRMPARRTANCDCRSTTRDAAADIVTGVRGRIGDGGDGELLASVVVGRLVSSGDAARFSDNTSGLCVVDSADLGGHMEHTTLIHHRPIVLDWLHRPSSSFNIAII